MEQVQLPQLDYSVIQSANSAFTQPSRLSNQKTNDEDFDNFRSFYDELKADIDQDKNLFDSEEKENET